MKTILYLLVFGVFLSACHTTKPTTFSPEVAQKIESPINRIIKDEQPSFDANEQNSGIIEFIDGKGWLITPNAAKRYNTLVELYGKELVPIVEAEFGLSSYYNNFILTQEAMVKFALLNQIHKSKIK